MKNINLPASWFLVFIGLIILPCVSSEAAEEVSYARTEYKTETSDQVSIQTNFLSSFIFPINTTDTLPFLRFRRASVEKSMPYQDPESTLFPDSKSYRLPYSCKVTFDGKDPITGERKKELEYEPLLSYTSPHLKTYLPGKDLLKAEGKLIKFSGGYTYLSIQFHWNAKNPQGAYGRLKAKGAIRFILTSDKSITLYNYKESLWRKDGDQISHSMQTSFLLHQKQIKLLEKYPIMKLTVFWERGFEEYPIYPISIFMNQLKCLE